MTPPPPPSRSSVPVDRTDPRPLRPDRAGPGLRITLYVIAAVQAVLGAAFVVAPAATALLLGLPPAPAWTGWLFAQMGARFLGYAVGMVAAARDPQRHELWIHTMIGVQVIDWVATVSHLATGQVSLAQVATAPFLPVVFVAALLAWRPRPSRPHRGSDADGDSRRFRGDAVHGAQETTGARSGSRMIWWRARQ